MCTKLYFRLANHPFKHTFYYYLLVNVKAFLGLETVRLWCGRVMLVCRSQKVAMVRLEQLGQLMKIKQKELLEKFAVITVAKIAR